MLKNQRFLFGDFRNAFRQIIEFKKADVEGRIYFYDVTKRNYSALYLSRS